MKLVGRVALVTGGGSGIGAATCRLFAAEGAKVVVVDRNGEGASSVAREIGEAAQAVTADVTDGALAEATTRETIARWGSVDIVVTCAAISSGGTVANTKSEDWDRVFAVNVKGSFLWIQPALRQMIERKRGSIVMIASQLAFNNAGNNAAYIASKGAIVSLAKTMAVDHARDGIRVNAIAPGVIDTPMPARSLLRYADPEIVREKWRQRHPMGRIGRPEEVARAILFLASDDSSFTTGSTLFVDGGYTAH
jgi:NAD(P)-dependent dehydrogenase (short-subunit alcohol dehydrogenase family)